jgi:serine/threonine protein kinase
VAVKLLSAFGVASRFRSEIAVLGRVPPHPNLAAFVDAGVHGAGLPFLVLELVAGEPLAELLAREWPDVPRALAIATGVLRGLGHLHASGVVHRDLNAGNIVIQASGEPRLVDFGLALDLGRSTRLSETGELVGTIALLAPEQLDGDELGPAVDLYAAAALLHHLLTRRPLFSEPADGAALALRIREEVPRLVSDLVPAVPAVVARAIARGLAKRPQDRPRSAEELAMLLGGRTGDG